MNTNLTWNPNLQVGSGTTFWNWGSLQQWDLDRIRTIVQEEVHKALHPEEQRESVEVAFELDEKRYKGIVYLVESDSEADEE